MTLKTKLEEAFFLSSSATDSALEDAYMYFVLAILGIAFVVSRVIRNHGHSQQEEDSK